MAMAAMTLLVVGAVFSCQSMSTDKADAQPAQEMDMAEMMALWQEMNAIGPEHDHLKMMAGKWDVKSKMWFGPGTEPTESKGSAECRLIMGGRYIEQKYEGSMMGQPFKGLSFEGYDNIKKKYVSIWMDSMSTGIFYAEGTMDESGKSTTYIGKADDPFTGEKDKEMKSVSRVINDDKVVFEMYEKDPSGNEFMSMELTYVRRK
jgi:hypothetical protein